MKAKERIKKNAVFIAGGIGIIAGAYLGFKLRPSYYNLLSKYGKKGAELVVRSYPEITDIGIIIRDLDTKESKGIRLSEKIAKSVADDIYRMVSEKER